MDCRSVDAARMAQLLFLSAVPAEFGDWFAFVHGMPGRLFHLELDQCLESLPGYEPGIQGDG